MNLKRGSANGPINRNIFVFVIHRIRNENTEKHIGICAMKL